MAKLKEAMDNRIKRVADRIQREKEKYLTKVNKGRSDKPVLPQGSIVFLRNYSIPKNGRARKFRPYYLRSPQIVMTASRQSVVTLRLSDSFVSRHHPDDLIPYKGNEKDPQLYDSLPPEVLAFLGKPMSATSLVELAKTDSLDIIYSDMALPDKEAPVTRSKTAGRLDLAKAYHLVQAHADADIPQDEEIAEFDSSMAEIPTRELDRSRTLHTILEE